jgi:ribosomal protein S18 acetylase RimI-like enzyme
MTSSRLRELREEDAEQVAALFVDAFGDARKLDAREVRAWLRDPDLRPEDLRVLEEDGRAVGYCDVAVRNDALYVDLVAPGRWAELLAWAEGEATGRGLGRTSLYVPHEHELADVAAGGGYEKRRESLTMEIALDEPPRDGDFGSLELRTYRDGDRDALIDALNDAFAEDPAHRIVTAAGFEARFLETPGHDPTLWFLLWDGSELAGFALDFPEFGTDTDIGWVGWLGVRRPWRRRGLAEALLHRSFAELYARGKRRVGLGVDADNVTGALRLYERVGMRAVRRYGIWQKDL